MAGSTPDDDSRPGLEELLLRSGRGDVEAFAGVYDELAPRVHGLATRLLHDSTAAETLTVAAFLEAWRRAPSYDPTTASAAAWVLALTHTVAVRTARRSGSPHGCEATETCADDSVLHAAGLSPTQAQVVHLAYFDGLDHLQIAALLECTEPVPDLITDGLGLIASAAPRR